MSLIILIETYKSTFTPSISLEPQTYLLTPRK